MKTFRRSLGGWAVNLDARLTIMAGYKSVLKYRKSLENRHEIVRLSLSRV